jgi:hypothetical protein
MKHKSKRTPKIIWVQNCLLLVAHLCPHLRELITLISMDSVTGHQQIPQQNLNKLHFKFQSCCNISMILFSYYTMLQMVYTVKQYKRLRCSLHLTCNTVSQHTCKCNFSYAHKKSSDFTALIVMKLIKHFQHHYVQNT